MSYRSIKRVLGETHLERKCLFLFGVCLLVLTAGSFWLYGSQTEKLVYKQNRNKGRLLVDTILTHIHWKHLQTERQDRGPQVEARDARGNPVPASPEDTDAIDLADALGKELRNEEYKWRTIKPFAADEAARGDDEYDYQIVEQFLRSNQQQPATPAADDRGMTDRFADWWSGLFSDDDDEEQPQGELADVEFAERRVPEKQEYHYYQVVRASRSICVDCHRILTGPPNLMEGDILAIMKVRISDKPVQKDIQWNNAILWFTAILTAFLLVVASYVIIRYVIVKPLQHLQNVSDAISKGDLEKRAEIHTGDEFEALGVAFNRMVRHLIAVQEELRQVNSDLDAKVDELAQRNMQLYELNRLKSDFLATVSHELRTPLNSIIGFSDILGSADTLTDKQRRYVSNILNSGKHLLEMINDILDLAKIESGKMEVRPSNFRIGHTIAAQCDMARPLSERSNIDLETDIQPDLPELYQDQGKIAQILNNLLSNAIKFTPEGGRIVVRAGRHPSGDLNLVVSDTGIGISEEDQTRIFEKFRQGSAVLPTGDAMTKEYAGTGLGLSIVKELCKLLGGEVSVESELGKGSTFTVRLPWNLPPQAENGDTLRLHEGFLSTRPHHAAPPRQPLGSGSD